MAPNNRPSSPTSLLWAHQLKREHGFLLERMKKLEDEISKVDTAAKSSKSSTASYDIAAIAQKVQALADGGGSRETNKVREAVMERLENVEGEVEAITLKVATIDQDAAKVEEDRRKAFNNEKGLVKRVKEVEVLLKDYEKRLNVLGTKTDAQMEAIRQRLDGAIEDMKEGGETQERIDEKFQLLEQVVDELKQGNERLSREIKELGKRPAAVPVQAPAPAPAPAPTTAVAKSSPPRIGRTRSACDDCRLQRIRCTHHNHANNNDVPNETAEAPQAAPTKAKAPKPAPKPVARRTIDQDETQAPRLKPAAQPAKRGLARELQQLKAGSQFMKQYAKKEPDTSKATISQGRGWVKVERTPSVERVQLKTSSPGGATAAERVKRARAGKVLPTTEAPAPAAKRGRGRPRKDSSQSSAPAPAKAPATRRTIKQQEDETQADAPPKRGRGRPRKDSPQATPAVAKAPPPRRSIRHPEGETQAQPAPAKHPRGRPRKDGPQNTQAPAPAPAPKQRRTIKQQAVESSPERPPQPAIQSKKRAAPAADNEVLQPAAKRRVIAPNKNNNRILAPDPESPSPTKKAIPIKKEPIATSSPLKQSAVEKLKNRRLQTAARVDPYALPDEPQPQKTQGQRRGLTGVFSSPMSSPPAMPPFQPAVRSDGAALQEKKPVVKQQVRSAGTAMPRKRRTIEQDD